MHIYIYIYALGPLSPPREALATSLLTSLVSCSRLALGRWMGATGSFWAAKPCVVLPAYVTGTLPVVSIVVPFFWFNQKYNKDPIRYPPKGTTMETTGKP